MELIDNCPFADLKLDVYRSVAEEGLSKAMGSSKYGKLKERSREIDQEI